MTTLPEIAEGVGPDRIDITYQCLGDPSDPPVLLIMGGGQMVTWPDGFLDELVARALRVIRFDNRDSGLSTHLPAGPAPDLAAAMAGDVRSASYTLSAMAADTVGLLDHLGLASAHLVGLSQGGMIGQTVAIEYPDRIRSLTSMMSTTGAPDVGQPDFSVLTGIGAPPPDAEAYIAWQVRALRTIGGTAFPIDEQAAQARARLAYQRDHDEVAGLRQKIAVLASGDRTASLRALDTPTLVIHGTADPMIDASGGRATAHSIPGAELFLVEGLGHSLPRQLWRPFAKRIAALIRRAEQAGVEVDGNR